MLKITLNKFYGCNGKFKEQSCYLLTTEKLNKFCGFGSQLTEPGCFQLTKANLDKLNEYNDINYKEQNYLILTKEKININDNQCNFYDDYYDEPCPSDFSVDTGYSYYTQYYDYLELQQKYDIHDNNELHDIYLNNKANSTKISNGHTVRHVIGSHNLKIMDKDAKHNKHISKTGGRTIWARSTNRNSKKFKNNLRLTLNEGQN